MHSIINTSLHRRKEEDSSDSELGATDKDAEDFLRDPKKEGLSGSPGLEVSPPQRVRTAGATQGVAPAGAAPQKGLDREDPPAAVGPGRHG